jgi:hypothetical protein
VLLSALNAKTISLFVKRNKLGFHSELTHIRRVQNRLVHTYYESFKPVFEAYARLLGSVGFPKSLYGFQDYFGAVLRVIVTVRSLLSTPVSIFSLQLVTLMSVSSRGGGRSPPALTYR